jgi:hypothetical protein
MGAVKENLQGWLRCSLSADTNYAPTREHPLSTQAWKAIRTRLMDGLPILETAYDQYTTNSNLFGEQMVVETGTQCLTLLLLVHEDES